MFRYFRSEFGTKTLTFKMSKDILQLKAKRSALKGSITRTENFVNDQLNLNSAVEVFEARKDRLISTFKEYENTQVEIYMYDEQDNEDFSVIEEKYYKILAQLNRAIKNTTTIENSKSINVSNSKLPNIEMPSFSGKDFSQFRPFIEMFTALIDKNTSLDNIQKLFYLRKYLNDEALSIIINLPLVNDSYNKALELLMKRYDNKSRLISNHIGVLLDIPVMQKGTASAIRMFITEVQQQIYALKNLDQPVENWDMLLISILSRKLDQYTFRSYQLDRDSDILPTLKNFISFLEKRAIALEESPHHNNSNSNKASYSKSYKVINVAIQNNCSFCNNTGHLLYKCPKFKLASLNERQRFITASKLCTICLKSHVGKCKLNIKCLTCKQSSHNSLLHHDDEKKLVSNSVVYKNTNENLKPNSFFIKMNNNVIIPTVKVMLFDKSGRPTMARAILDSGSQVSFITSSLVRELGLQPIAQTINIISIGNKSSQIDKSVNLTISSYLHENVKFKINCYTIEKITTTLPQIMVDMSDIVLPVNVKLADDEFYKPSQVQMLLGADIYFNSLLNNNIKLNCGLVLQKTLFGYVVGGNMSCNNNKNNFVSNLTISDCSKLENLMERFWLSEEIPQSPIKMSDEFQKAERVFQESVKLNDNRFYVDLPLVSPLEDLHLGDSFSVALQRFLALESKFKKNPEYLREYTKFIHEYIALGHAKKVDIDNYNIYDGPVYFLSHHLVTNESSKSSKFRVVFNGSMKSKNKISLNDVLLNGPIVQNNLFEILLLFRTFKFTLMCDIQKMFRQVYLNDHHKCLQNILWRDNPTDPISCLQLQTATYGLKPSGYLCSRCMVELVNLYGERYSLAAEAILKHTYVDDIIYGSDDEEQLVVIKNQLIDLLQLGSFTLHKWCSNSHTVLSDIENDKKYFEEIYIGKDNITKTLGLKYDIVLDTFTYTVPDIENDLNTKRRILSFIGKFFDPLGLIGPITVLAKLFIQQLWQLKISWDSIISHEKLSTWKSFLNNLIKMGTIKIPRGVSVSNMASAELIGYADASSKAYGCCIYIRIIYPDGRVTVNLLCSKSRIAPLNKTLTIPKLELNSTLLLSQLVARVSQSLKTRYSNIKIFLYSDSQIALSWINTPKLKYNVFVSNRVSQILNLSDSTQWSYVKSCDNPADLLSRGFDPSKLQSCMLWWNGPNYLQNINFQHVKYENQNIFSTDMDLDPNIDSIMSNMCSVDSKFCDIFEKFSDMNRLQRVLAYILRFKNNTDKNKVKFTGSLSPKELQNSLTCIIRCVQSKYFSNEKQLLLNDKPIKEKLSSLHPFLDQNSVIRVGGRLQNANNIPYNKMHPIILPKSCHVTDLIIKREHLRLLHAGAKLVLSSLNQTFWLLNGTRSVKKIVHSCMKCARLKAAVARQLMGSLPPERITASRPFQIVGIDFCGPFNMKVARIRNPIITKSYIALFVCFSTKALHLELISDLRTETFLACLKRFVSRRGMPTKMFCDNGKTFVGARNLLKDLYESYNKKYHKELVEEFCSLNSILFKFIPSYSPEFGGLWEAGVKSVKGHFKKVVGELSLTFEELYTVITQIEAVLNSRPLMPMSSDISDLTYLTPGHFLIGSPLTSLPEIDLVDTPIHRLKFWNVCTKLKQDFWKAWSKDYLSQLHSRPKWKYSNVNIKEGDLVIVKHDNMPPLQWPMARVVKIFPGPDGRVRVAEIKMGSKIYKRSYRKLCPLPMMEQ